MKNFEDVISTLKETNFPVAVLVETTAFCNLRCSMCPQKSLKRNKGEISFDLFKKIADEIALENPSTKLWLAIMGEALLLEDKLISMIKYAKNTGLESIHLNTNGVLMSTEIIDKLVDSGVDEIIIGFDAFTEETYNKLRVGGNFNVVKKNIHLLLKKIRDNSLSKPNVVVQFIEMDENQHELDDFKNYWVNAGATVKVRPKIAWGTAVDAPNLDLNDEARNFPCPMLIRHCAIHWDGRVAHCSDADYECEYSPGNITEQSIKEIWNGELARRRRRHWKGDFNFEPCNNCRDWQMGRSKFYYPEKNY